MERQVAAGEYPERLRTSHPLSGGECPDTSRPPWRSPLAHGSETPMPLSTSLQRCLYPSRSTMVCAVIAREAVAVDRPQAMQMIGHQPKERRSLRPSGFADAARRWRRIGHARSGTEERRAYVRLGRGPSPFRCATGHSNATSDFSDQTMLAVDERTDHPHSAKYRAVRSQQKPALYGCACCHRRSSVRRLPPRVSGPLPREHDPATPFGPPSRPRVRVTPPC